MLSGPKKCYTSLSILDIQRLIVVYMFVSKVHLGHSHLHHLTISHRAETTPLPNQRSTFILSVSITLSSFMALQKHLHLLYITTFHFLILSGVGFPSCTYCIPVEWSTSGPEHVVDQQTMHVCLWLWLTVYPFPIFLLIYGHTLIPSSLFTLTIFLFLFCFVFFFSKDKIRAVGVDSKKKKLAPL